MSVDIEDDDDTHLTVRLTKTQYAGLKKLTDARSVKLFTLIDFMGDLQPDALEFLRRLGNNSGDDHKALLQFLANSRPETLQFLNGIQFADVNHAKAMIAFFSKSNVETLEFLKDIKFTDDDQAKGMSNFFSKSHVETLSFLAEMRVEEINLLRTSIRITIGMQWFVWAIKWLIGGSIAAFVALSTFAEQFKKVLSWWR